jgi:hypothetical protein
MRVSAMQVNGFDIRSRPNCAIAEGVEASGRMDAGEVMLRSTPAHSHAAERSRRE